MLDDIERRHRVERAVSEGKREGRSADSAGCEPTRVDVEGDGALGGIAQPGRAGAVGAAEVQGELDALDVRSERCLEQVGARDVPPVVRGRDRRRPPVPLRAIHGETLRPAGGRSARGEPPALTHRVGVGA